MKTICGQNCCDSCSRVSECGGCLKTDGHPFGGTCIASESIRQGGLEGYLEVKKNLIREINALGIRDLAVDDLNLLNGFFVNLEYILPNGEKIKLLKDEDSYLGNQIERPGMDRCYGISADMEYILVCEYGCNGSEPEIILYRRRQI